MSDDDHPKEWTCARCGRVNDWANSVCVTFQCLCVRPPQEQTFDGPKEPLTPAAKEMLEKEMASHDAIGEKIDGIAGVLVYELKPLHERIDALEEVAHSHEDSEIDAEPEKSPGNTAAEMSSFIEDAVLERLDALEKAFKSLDEHFDRRCDKLSWMFKKLLKRADDLEEVAHTPYDEQKIDAMSSRLEALESATTTHQREWLCPCGRRNDWSICDCPECNCPRPMVSYAPGSPLEGQVLTAAGPQFVRCEDCKCWEKDGKPLRGPANAMPNDRRCQREALSPWRAPTDGCWQGIPKEPAVEPVEEKDPQKYIVVNEQTQTLATVADLESLEERIDSVSEECVQQHAVVDQCSGELESEVNSKLASLAADLAEAKAKIDSMWHQEDANRSRLTALAYDLAAFKKLAGNVVGDGFNRLDILGLCKPQFPEGFASTVAECTAFFRGENPAKESQEAPRTVPVGSLEKGQLFEWKGPCGMERFQNLGTPPHGAGFIEAREQTSGGGVVKFTLDDEVNPISENEGE